MPCLVMLCAYFWAWSLLVFPHIPGHWCFGGSQYSPHCSVISEAHMLKIPIVSAENCFMKLLSIKIQYCSYRKEKKIGTCEKLSGFWKKQTSKNGAHSLLAIEVGRRWQISADEVWSLIHRRKWGKLLYIRSGLEMRPLHRTLKDA